MLWTLTDSWFESTQAHLPIWWPWSARSRPQHQCRTREAKKCTSCVPAPIAEAICMQLKREPDLRAYIARFACARLCKCCTVDKFQSVTRRRCRAHVIVLTASNDVVCSGRRRCVQSGRWVAWRGEWEKDDDVLIILLVARLVFAPPLSITQAPAENSPGNTNTAGCFKNHYSNIANVPVNMMLHWTVFSLKLFFRLTHKYIDVGK